MKTYKYHTISLLIDILIQTLLISWNVWTWILLAQNGEDSLLELVYMSLTLIILYQFFFSSAYHYLKPSYQKFIEKYRFLYVDFVLLTLLFIILSLLTAASIYGILILLLPLIFLKKQYYYRVFQSIVIFVLLLLFSFFYKNSLEFSLTIGIISFHLLILYYYAVSIWDFSQR